MIPETPPPDLSSFQQQVLAYDQYVGLAYGFAALILIILVMTILTKHRRLKKDLTYFEEKA